jgi:hypothetical protein
MWPTLTSLWLTRSGKALARPAPRLRPAFCRPLLEALEDRTLLSTATAFWVTNTGDNGGVNPAAGAGTGTLRQALVDANAAGTGTAASPNLVQFNIPTTDAGYNGATGAFSIALLSALPTVTDTVVIDGFTQPGSGMNTLPLSGAGAGDNAVRLSILDGTQLSGGSYDLGTFGNSADASAALDAEAGPTGLTIAAGNCTVSGLVFQNFSAAYYDFYPGIQLGPVSKGAAVHLLSSGNTVAGNYVTNTADGVFIDNAPNNTIGGTTPGARNVFAANSQSGVVIQGAGAMGNQVQGDYIGTDGSQLLGGGIQVFINDGSDNTVAGNLIASSGRGIDIGGESSPVSGNVVQGNYVGVNAAGTAAIPGLGAFSEGVVFSGYFTNNTVGGTTPSARNVIAGWGYAQVDLDFNGLTGFGGNVGNVVGGNYIGTNAAGSAALVPGTGHFDFTSPYPLGINAAVNTTISGNLISGLALAVVAAPGTQVQGNLIGTDATGTQPIPNVVGVVAGGPAVIGGTGPGAGNTIAFNAEEGVDVGGVYLYAGPSPTGPGTWVVAPTGVQIEGNSIHDNGALGITFGRQYVTLLTDSTDDAGPLGVTLNTPGGPHVGPNYLQNYPVLTAAQAGSMPLVSGTLNGQADTTFTVDVYADPTVDASDLFQGQYYGEGQYYLGSTTVTTDGSGNVTFAAAFSAANLPGGALPAGWYVSATATDPGGNSSEFGADIQATNSNPLQPALTAGGTVTVQTTASGQAPVILAAANALNPATTPAATVLLELNGQTVQEAVADVPPQLTLTMVSGTFVGGSPALAVQSGQVIVQSSTFSNATNTPTILVSGGSLTLGEDVVQSSTAYNEPAISVTGGTVDLGTSASPGGNTININGAGAFVQNTTATPVSAVGTTFTVNGSPLTLSSLSGVVWEDFNDDGQVDFGEQGIGGVTITLSGTDFLGDPVSLSQKTDGYGAYVFSNLLPGAYYLTETLPPAGYLQGTDSVGTAGGSVSATDQFFVQLGVEVNGLNYNFGELPAAGGSVGLGQTAGIGFWNNKNGQALIQALNGGGSSTQLANWLADTLPNTFGNTAGSNNLTGKTNAAVAALFQSDFLLKGVKLDAQVLATALSVYVTSATLDPTKVAAQYGFTVGGDGAGTATINVGGNGDAFGVANNTTMTLMGLLKATDAQTVAGVLYNGNTTRRNEANTVYSVVNQDGGIS